MTSGSGRTEAQRRRRSVRRRQKVLAVAAVAGLHLALFAIVASDWAIRRLHAEPPTVFLTLEPPPPDMPEPPRPAPPPPPDAAPPPATLTARPAEAASSPVAPLVADRQTAAPSGAPIGPVRPGAPALDLGCLNPNLKGKAKQDCDEPRLARGAPLGLTSRQMEARYAVLEPPPVNPPKPLEPGLHFVPPFGFKLVVDKDDKGFPPGLGKTKTTVFEPAEIYNVPTPNN